MVRHLTRAEPSSLSRPAFFLWHADCIAQTMTDERYVALLLWTICVLCFACGVAAITQHPEWFGA